MLKRLLLVLALLQSMPGFSWTQFSTRDAKEIRNILSYHRRLLDEYLMYGVENPGTRITEARVRYITVWGEAGGDKYYNCELNTELLLSDNTRMSDKVEVEKKCEHVF